MADEHIKPFGITATEPFRNLNTRWFLRLPDGNVEELTQRIDSDAGITQTNTFDAVNNKVHGRVLPRTTLVRHRGGYAINRYFTPPSGDVSHLENAIKAGRTVELIWYQEDAGYFEMATYEVQSGDISQATDFLYSMSCQLQLQGKMTYGYMRTATGSSADDKPSFDQNIPAGVFPVVIANAPATPALSSVTIKVAKDASTWSYVLDSGWSAGALKIVKGEVNSAQTAQTGATISIDARDGAVPNSHFIFGVGFEYEFEQG